MSVGHLPQSSSSSRFTAGAAGFFILSPTSGRGLKSESAPISGPLFEFGTVAANISELFGPLEKPPLGVLPFFLGC
jgi:hypothetical protein